VGAYFAFVSSVDADQLEGKPGEPARLAVAAFALLPPEGLPPGTGTVVGGRVVAPDGFTCGDEGRTFRIARAGATDAVCASAAGRTAPLHIVAAAPALHLAAGALTRGQRTLVELDTSLPVAAVLSLSSPDAQVDSVVALSDRRVRAAVTPRIDVD